MKRFKLEKSQNLPNWWVLTDTENLIVIRFEHGKYNESQQATVLDESRFNNASCIGELSTIIREIGEYMVRYHGGIAFDSVYGLEHSEEDETLFLCRYKSPKWRLELMDKASKEEWASSLRKAAEWLTKRQ